MSDVPPATDKIGRYSIPLRKKLLKAVGVTDESAERDIPEYTTGNPRGVK